MKVASILVATLGTYLACGLLFALPFALVGVNRIDPHAKPGTWGFRILILPGTVFLWPMLLRRWIRGVQEPPEECNAHRSAARPSPPHSP